MDDTPRSSFIPKQSPGMIPSTVRKRKRFYVFGFLGSVCLIGSILLAAGVFFLKDRALSKLEAEKQTLSLEQGNLKSADIQTVRVFEHKLNAAKYLLNNHISPSKVFEVLEIATLKPVQFTSFKFEQRPSQDVTLEVIGGTEEFKTIALQAFEFDKSPILENAIFTDLETSDNAESEEINGNRISFTVTGDISSSLLTYGEQNIGIESSDNVIHEVTP